MMWNGWFSMGEHCPLCETETLGVYVRGQTYRVKCKSCGIVGPAADRDTFARMGFDEFICKAFLYIRAEKSPILEHYKLDEKSLKIAENAGIHSNIPVVVKINSGDLKK